VFAAKAKGDHPTQKEISVPSHMAPSSFVNNVNTIFGSFHDAETDLIVPGPTPLHFTRYYNSESFFHGPLGYMAMGVNYPGSIKGLLRNEVSYDEVTILEDGGSILHYATNDPADAKKCKYYLHREVIHEGFTNTGSGEISGRTNLKNSYYTFEAKNPDDQEEDSRGIWKGFLADGSMRKYFKTYDYEDAMNLKYEQKPNGNILLFDYHKTGRVKNIEVKNSKEKHVLAWLHFTESTRDNTLKVASSNGKEANYQFFQDYDDNGQTTLYLKKVTSSDIPTTQYKYTQKGPRSYLSRIERPNGRYLEIEYDREGKVTRQSAPAGADGTKQVIWRFEYFPQDGYTRAWDANNHKTVFRYSEKNRLTHIEKYIVQDKDQKLYRTERLHWGEAEPLKIGKKIDSDEGNLLSKVILDHHDKALSSLKLFYDKYGNVLTEEFWGNLTGEYNEPFRVNQTGTPGDKNVECYRRHFTYSDDGYNLKLSQTEYQGPTILYRYKKNSDLLIASFTCDKDKEHDKEIIKIREFFEYDDDAILTKKIIDNGSSKNSDDLTGVTERRITTIIPVRGSQDHGVGQPATIIESYFDSATNNEVILQKRNFTYNTAGLVEHEEVIDGSGNHMYTLQSSYTNNGLLVHKVDEIGREYRYEYDKNFNKVRSELIGSGFYTTYTYDSVNKLLQESEHHNDGKIFTSSYKYDVMGNPISSRDHFGNKTSYEYDELNRVAKITFPAVLTSDGQSKTPKVKKAYDILDNVIAETDENGYTTKYQYNTRNQPVRIKYPDGSEERFQYNRCGTLAQKWSRSGTKTSYTYDYLKRVLSVETYDTKGALLTSTSNTYNAFHLLSTRDAMGYTITFSYDGAGRKIQELKQAGGNFEKTTYEYDFFGRVAHTKSWYGTGAADFIMTSATFDNLNRVIAEERQDGHGTLLSKSRYSYDIFGNKTRVENFQTLDKIAITQTLYTSKNLPETIIDELGNTTTITYNFNHQNALAQNVLEKTIKDPLGNITIEVYDALARLESVERQNAQKLPTAKNHFVYDLGGNKVRDIESVIIGGQVDHEYTIAFTYDSCDRLLTLTEQPQTALEKVTRYDYNQAGLLNTIYKPDGVRLNHAYDSLNRLISLNSSDQTIAYSYVWDKNNNPVMINDPIHGMLQIRKYDPWNRLISDSFLNGLEVNLQYDPLGRTTKCTLSDGSQVSYLYNDGRLSDVVRYDASEQEKYRHKYTSLDLQGNILESHLIGTCGTAAFTYDIQGRPLGISTPSWSEEIHEEGYDKVGNLHHMTIHDTVGVADCHFDYDDLYQLTKEDGMAAHSYQNDSISNRLAIDLNHYSLDSLNEITKTSDSALNYDRNGNLIEKKENGHTIQYRYDALNRLIEAKEEGVFLAEYLYDSFGRRLSKTITTPNGLNDSFFQFIYINNLEIGAYDAENTLVHFRALGRGRKADIGAAIAIELYDATYCPIHDARGNVSQLLSLDGTSYETMRYSAFGLAQVYDSTNEPITLSRTPWLFASKRFDPETGFFLFAKRYYSQDLGRFITPDPLGFADGPNLYAYVHENPIFFSDPYGLETDPNSPNWVQSPTVSSAWVGAPWVEGALHSTVGQGLITGALDPLSPLKDLYHLGGMIGNSAFTGNFSAFSNLSREEVSDSVISFCGKGVGAWAVGRALGGAIQGGRYCFGAVRQAAAATKVVQAAETYVSKIVPKIWDTIAIKKASLIAAQTPTMNPLYSKRRMLYDNVRQIAGAAGKHIPDNAHYLNHPYMRTQAVLNMNLREASATIKALSGTGLPKKGVMGLAGYQETIACGRPIGVNKTFIEETGEIESTITEWITVHYRKTGGAHAVPEAPAVWKRLVKEWGMDREGLFE
jgi:RHS repeat-associated protein